MSLSRLQIVSFLIFIFSFLSQVGGLYLSPYNSWPSYYPPKSGYSYQNTYNPYNNYVNAFHRSDVYPVSYPSYPAYQNSYYYQPNNYASSYYPYNSYQTPYYPYGGYQNSYYPYQNSYYSWYNPMQNRVGGDLSIRVGDSTVRMMGKDAELLCSFPPSEYVVSDITWTKSASPYVTDLAYRGQATRSADLHSGSFLLRDVRPEDAGYYRCTAKAQRGGSLVTLYNDVYLYSYGYRGWF